MHHPIASNLAVLAISFATGAGCANGDGGDQPDQSIYEQHQAASTQNWNLQCDCFEELGYASREQCMDELGYGTGDPKLDDCIAEIFAESPLVEDNLACETEALDSMTACLSELGCSEFGADDGPWEACMIAWLDAHEACPRIPQSVWDEVETCQNQ